MKDYRTVLGKLHVLTAGSAITALESAISEGISGWPGKPQSNIFGRPVDISEKQGLAYAMGLASAGLRASVCLRGEELMAELNVLKESVRRQLSFVVHLMTTSDSVNVDHSAYHAAAASGCIQLFASSVQDAIDLTILAHNVSELALVPVIVAVDNTWTCAEQVTIPNAGTLKDLLGTTDDFITSPIPSQKLIFGKTRRRIPNWFHFDFPVAQGLEKTASDATLEKAAYQQFVEPHFPEIIRSAMAQFSTLTGRSIKTFAEYKAEDAEYLILGQGAFFRRAAEGVDWLRSNKVKAGVLHLNLGRPFPGPDLGQLIKNRTAITTLERLSGRDFRQAPLFKEVLAVLDKAGQNAGKKKNIPFSDYPAMTERQKPILYSGHHGVESSAPTVSDIISVFNNMVYEGRRSFYVDIEFHRHTSSYPKQQILLQYIKRDYPQVEEVSLKTDKISGSTLNETMAIRWCMDNSESWISEFIESMAGFAAKRLNARVLTHVPGEGGYQINLRRLQDPIVAEKEYDVDVLFTNVSSLNRVATLDFLKDGARVVFVQVVGATEIQLKAAIASVISRKKLKLYRLPLAAHIDALSALFGSGVAILSEMHSDKKDVQKEIDGLDKFNKDLAGRSLSDDQKAGIFQGLSGLERVETESDLTSIELPPAEIPMVLRKTTDKGPAYTRISQFYDRVGYFASTGRSAEILADPFQSLPIAPAATSNFIDAGSHRQSIPNFTASKCTGCGACSVMCPHLALPSIVIPVESLLKSAVDTAQSMGTSMNQWTPPVQKNMAKVTTQLISQNKLDIGGLTQVFPEAFGKLTTQMKVEGARLEEMRDQFNIIQQQLSSFHGAVTKLFFEDAEVQSKGTGHLFSITVNPQACTGCGLCVLACNEEALEMSAETAEVTTASHASFRLWEQLPDTPGDIVLRMVDNTQYNPVAAVMLSRNYYMSMAGGSMTDHRALEKTIMHAVTAVTESVIQSGMNKQLKTIDEFIRTLSEKVRVKLAESVPSDNFDDLLDALHKSDESRLGVDVLIAKLGSMRRFGVVETAWIERLISLTKELQTLSWVLSTGQTGLGRARFGTVVATRQALRWAKRFPFNTMSTPVSVCDHSEAADFVLGLCKGHIRQMVDNIKLLRRAALESQNKYDPPLHDEQIANLGWSDLTREEKILVPPVFLVTDVEMFSQSNLPSMMRLLSSDYPVKILLMDDASGDASYWQARLGVLMQVVSLRKAFYLQSSLANPRHFFKGITDGLHDPTPALFHLLAPKSVNYEWATDEFLQLSSDSRAFPLFRFRPSKEKSYFSTAFDLSANPAPFDDFLTDEISYQDSGETKSIKYKVTFADWAYRQPELRNHFGVIDGSTKHPLSVSEYLLLDESDRTGKTPCITLVDENGARVGLTVSTSLVKSAEAARLVWNTLRDLAGMLTPHPLKLKEALEEELTKKHNAAIDQIKVDYEEKLRQQEKTQLEAVKQKLRDKFLALSGYKS